MNLQKVMCSTIVNGSYKWCPLIKLKSWLSCDAVPTPLLFQVLRSGVKKAKTHYGVKKLSALKPGLKPWIAE